MAGRQTFRILIIVNRKREFAELAEGRYTVREEGDPCKGPSTCGRWASTSP
ncbi:hypothetical protein [Calidithermus timidus]|uniref:hypothetical protein n=1 Tax=Calidithermus timidus TaxID=307124 RepID=UPI00037F1ED4|nr:hypothetical protein [Calidithermus timidus]